MSKSSPIGEEKEKIEIRAWASSSSNLRSRLNSLDLSGHRSNQNSISVTTDQDGGGNEVKAWANFQNIGKAARNLERTKVGRSGGHNRLRYSEGSNGLNSTRILDWSRHFVDEEIALTHTYGENEELKSLKLKDTSKTSAERKIFSVYFLIGANNLEVSEHLPNKQKTSPHLLSFFNHFNGTMPQVTSIINSKLYASRFFHFLDWNLRSIGQVYFCNNPLSGLLILLALFVQSTRVAIHGLTALFTGNALALLLGFDRGLISSGLFGYCPVLVGLAIATFHSTKEYKGYDLAVAIATMVTSALSVVVFVSMSKILVPYKSPPLTLPFNIATHIFLLSVATMHNVPFGADNDRRLYEFDNDQGLISAKDFFTGTIRGIGQVFLANHLVSGVLVLAGIAVCSRYLLVAAFIGSLLGNAFAVLAGAPNTLVEQGLFGYNSSLTLAGIFLFYVPSLGCMNLGILGIMLTVLAQHALEALYKPWGLPVGTVPFCLITLPLILLQGTTSMVIAVPLSSITIPEDHLRRVNLLKDGFNFLIGAIKSTEGARTKLLKRSRKTSKLLDQILSFITKGETKELFLPTIASYNEDEMHAFNIFKNIDATEQGSISRTQFCSYLKSIGLIQEDGLEFGGIVFDLMDLNEDGKLQMEEFVAFASVSRYLADIHHVVANFFASVDTDEDDEIDFDELDSALLYLSEPPLTNEERERLSIVGGGGNSVNSTDIVNFVTISTLRELINLYREKKQ